MTGSGRHCEISGATWATARWHIVAAMGDLVLNVLSRLVPGGVRPGELRRDDRVLRWAESGSGRPVVVLDAALAEPGTLAWAGVMPLVAPRVRVVAYDRAGLGTSDPASRVTLQTQVDDLAAVVRAAGGSGAGGRGAGGRCVVAGHSWGGLLGQLAAQQHPELIAGLVLVDPAEEEFLAWLPEAVRQQEIASGDAIVEQHADGTLPDTIRDTFGPFARRLTDDQQLQALILDAYVSCYARESQARAVAAENHLAFESVLAIHRARAAAALPDVPVVILSATKGRSQDERQKWTSYHARLAASLPGGEHVVLADSDHALNQERPAEIARAITRVIDAVGPL
jgi:pimeloyl-ACP methyl ester carboxylesterase